MKTLKIVFVMVAISVLSPSFATEGNLFGQIGEFLENLDVEFTITAPVVQHEINQYPTHQYPVIQQPVTVPCNRGNRGNGRGQGRSNCYRPYTAPSTPVAQQPTQVYVPVIIPRTVVQQPIYTPVQQPVYTQPAYTPVQQPVTHTPYTNTTTSSNDYYGYATYQDYLDSFYAQNSGNASTSTTSTSYAPPATTHVDTSYQGFASYQDYLDNYYANDSASVTSSSSYGSGYVDSNHVAANHVAANHVAANHVAANHTSSNYVASTQITTTPIHAPAPVVNPVATPVPAVVGYTASTSISYSHLPTGYFNLGYEQGYIINNSTRLNLVDIERSSGGHNVLVLRVVQNNQPRQVRVNLAQSNQTVLQIGGKRLQVVGLEQVNNRNVVRCYLVN